MCPIRYSTTCCVMVLLFYQQKPALASHSHKGNVILAVSYTKQLQLQLPRFIFSPQFIIFHQYVHSQQLLAACMQYMLVQCSTRSSGEKELVITASSWQARKYLLQYSFQVRGHRNHRRKARKMGRIQSFFPYIGVTGLPVFL